MRIISVVFFLLLPYQQTALFHLHFHHYQQQLVLFINSFHCRVVCHQFVLTSRRGTFNCGPAPEHAAVMAERLDETFHRVSWRYWWWWCLEDHPSGWNHIVRITPPFSPGSERPCGRGITTLVWFTEVLNHLGWSSGSFPSYLDNTSLRWPQD